MDLQQIKYFLALARELHFWNTAGKMNITQSALTRQIQSLEAELGIQLFERNKRNVKLTPAGRFLKEKWEVELNELEFFHEHARQIQLGESGTIIIAHPDSISASIMPDMISRIATAFPKLKIELMQVRYEDQTEFLRNYKADLAITRDITTAEDIRSRKIYTDHLAIVVPDAHPFRDVSDITTESLASQKFILPIKDEGSSYSDIIQQMFRHFDVVPDAYLHSEFGSAITALVRKGLGIAIMPDSYIHHQIPGIRFISMPFKTDLYLNWRVEEHHPVLDNVLKLILE
ncbi:LysR family transcriptional regulator [Mucilaginibacter pedocola]|uniref:LysR family transcriptional regulator n=1 Tax=Mucilaginibacter pedocola TaxID=1792845 RepID=A0A1S9PJT3_9SPHI|nr:LysR family transcriptional regulator [Mucilaginibacter pedocola]OOQ61197.1 LysR family transcriptional regulator [Mucilaginibacter pedocola]